MGISVAHPQSGYSSTVSRPNWNLEMLVFVEVRKPEYPEKNSCSRDENQQQTQPRYSVDSGNQTQPTMMGGECSHHCAIPAPHMLIHHSHLFTRLNIFHHTISIAQMPYIDIPILALCRMFVP